MRKTLAIAVGVAIWALLSSCTPTVTITAKPETGRPGCGRISTITGTVTPATATSKVVLQRTIRGKWVDWIWLDNTDQDAHRLVGTVNRTTGTYAIPYLVPSWDAPIHLRVRSGGGSVISPGFYVTPISIDTDECSFPGSGVDF